MRLPKQLNNYSLVIKLFKTEFERLYTFRNWQYSDIVSPMVLVKNGFYLNDDQTKIICVECDYNIHTSRLRDIDATKSHKQISPKCRQVSQYVLHGSTTETSTGQQSENSNVAQPLKTSNQATTTNICASVPMYSGQLQRKETLKYWNSNLPEINMLVEAGFYYTGESDVFRCFSCDIRLANWKPTDDPWIEHARHSPTCTFLKDNKTQDFIDNVQHAWLQIYEASHSRYTEKSERIKSFQNSGWPYDYVRQTPAELAEAGFFYTGITDTVRCHYCDGGLRDWEPEDDPWIEHGRWFSSCKFVIRQKGTPFIRECATGNGSRHGTSEPPVSKNLPKSYANPENPMKTAAALSVKEMGYPTATVKCVINAYIAKTGKRDFNACDLMHIIFDMEEQGQLLLDTCTSDGKSDSDSENNEFELTPQALMKENEVMKNKSPCMGCKTKERTNVFVPCGHRLMCEDCAKKETRCCQCDTPIRTTIKTYLV